MEDSKILKEIGNKQPFTVPENYFEDFSARIDAQLKPKTVALFRQTRTWLCVAAAVIGAIFVLNIVQQNNEKDLMYKQLEAIVAQEDGEDELLAFFLDL